MILNRILKVANFELSSHKIWPELTRIAHIKLDYTRVLLFISYDLKCIQITQ
jgi:hypothetical protein